ncbi:MAG: hypothetical protein AB9880_05930 [Christensenellales bacterium]
MKHKRGISLALAVTLLFSLMVFGLGLSTAKAATQLRLCWVWASYCTYCKQELDDLVRFTQTLQGLVEVVAIQADAVDEEGKLNPYAIQKGKDVLAQFGANFPNQYPNEDNAYLMDQITGYPNSFFLDAEGKVLQHIGGTTVDPDGAYDQWSMYVLILAGSDPTPTPTPEPTPKPSAEPTAQPALPGDADLSGVIDLQDLVALIDYLVAGKAPASMENANADGLGEIDIQDLVWIIDKIVGG